MKKKKSLGLTLNKRKVSELTESTQNQIVGGSGYHTQCGCGPADTYHDCYSYPVYCPQYTAFC